MTKEKFQELLKKYVAGECSAEEIDQIDTWFDNLEDEDLELNDFEKTHVRERILASVKNQVPSRRGATTSSFLPTLLKIAAGISLTLLVGYFAMKQVLPDKSDDSVKTITVSDVVEISNPTNRILRVYLPDSSSVELYPNAVISYAPTQGSKREVKLVGEAFFQVVKDRNRPFYVYGGKVVTKVLGTSFMVKAAENSKSVEVAVRTGRVSVFEAAPETIDSPDLEAGGVVLTPNERVEYFLSDKHWVTSLVEKPAPLPASNKAVDFVFNNAPMHEIRENIQNTYSIEIIFENEASFSNCTFTGDVSMMELYDLLSVICRSTGSTYEVKGTKILIAGNGCQ